MPAVLALVCLLCLTSRGADSAPRLSGFQQAPETGEKAGGQEDAPSSEAFRLRIANTLHGGVEISVDRGATWLLVGRVTRPATTTASGAPSSLPVVLKVSKEGGMAFGVGGKRLMRLLPDSQPARRDRAAILVNVRPTSALFKDFLPPLDSPVQQVVTQHVVPLPQNYAPGENDRLLITALRTSLPSMKIEDYARDAAERYRDEALSRLRAQGRKPVTGMLTVQARLTAGDEPKAVTFALDGEEVAIINRAPFTVHWDTREWKDGEHLIEVRARDSRGGVLTQTKALVLVDNRP